MAALALLALHMGEDPALFASVRSLIQLHIEEGTYVVPPSQPAPAPLPCSEVAVRTPPSGSTTTNSDSNEQPVVEKVAAAPVEGLTAAPPRRIAGAVPATPYTPLSMRKHRRPNSAAVLTDHLDSTATTGTGTSGAPSADHVASRTAQPAAATPTADGPVSLSARNRHQRRGEFIDRWLEKLYFRNPAVVTQRRSGSAGVRERCASSGQGSFTPTAAAAAQPCSSETSGAVDDAKPAGGLEVVHLNDVRDDEEIVAQLPPKPQGLLGSRVRQDLLVERLTMCFSQPVGATAHPPQSSTAAGSPTTNGVGSSNWLSTRPLSPATYKPKPAPPPAAATASSISSSVALPSISRFVEKKRSQIA